MSTASLSFLANGVISVAYFAIAYAIAAPLVREGQLRANRLGATTAAIFFSCAVGHGFHGLHALQMARNRTALRAYGCTRAQGYLYGRPRPEVELDRYLREHAGAPETSRAGSLVNGARQ